MSSFLSRPLTLGAVCCAAVPAAYEAPLFAKNSWLTDLSSQFIAGDPGYDAGDLLPPIAKAAVVQERPEHKCINIYIVPLGQEWANGDDVAALCCSSLAGRHDGGREQSASRPVCWGKHPVRQRNRRHG